MTDRTDAERFAFCFENDSVVTFTKDSREVSADIVVIKNIKFYPYAKRKVRSKAKAIDAWRKCMDELMKRDEKGGA